MRRLTTLSSAVIASLLLTACGGGSTSTASNTGTGVYVDSVIQGADYVCGTQTGVTDETGKFTFEVNQNCTFKIGNVLLREVQASSLSNNMTLFEDNVTVAQFLQTIDRDGDASNGIDIPSSAKTVLDSSNLTTVPTTDAELTKVKDDLDAKDDTYTGRVVSAVETDTHLKQLEQQLHKVEIPHNTVM